MNKWKSCFCCSPPPSHQSSIYLRFSWKLELDIFTLQIHLILFLCATNNFLFDRECFCDFWLIWNIHPLLCLMWRDKNMSKNIWILIQVTNVPDCNFQCRLPPDLDLVTCSSSKCQWFADLTQWHFDLYYDNLSSSSSFFCTILNRLFDVGGGLMS